MKTFIAGMLHADPVDRAASRRRSRDESKEALQATAGVHRRLEGQRHVGEEQVRDLEGDRQLGLALQGQGRLPRRRDARQQVLQGGELRFAADKEQLSSSTVTDLDGQEAASSRAS